MKTKRGLLSAVIALMAGSPAAWTPAVLAQDKYPTRPIRVLIPFPAGGAADTIGRSIGDRLAVQMGQPVVVDNRPGAAGRLATEMLAKAEPDGYTLLVGASGRSPSVPRSTPSCRTMRSATLRRLRGWPRSSTSWWSTPRAAPPTQNNSSTGQ